MIHLLLPIKHMPSMLTSLSLMMFIITLLVSFALVILILMLLIVMVGRHCEKMRLGKVKARSGFMFSHPQDIIPFLFFLEILYFFFVSLHIHIHIPHLICISLLLHLHKIKSFFLI